MTNEEAILHLKDINVALSYYDKNPISHAGDSEVIALAIKALEDNSKLEKALELAVKCLCIESEDCGTCCPIYATNACNDPKQPCELKVCDYFKREAGIEVPDV